MSMVKYNGLKPRISPINGSTDPAEIDRAQSLDKTTTMNRTKKKEIGTGFLGWLKGRLNVPYRLTQTEYGSMEFWRIIANKASSVETLSLASGHFDTSWFDIAGFATDVDGNFLGTELYPGMRCSGFGLNIGSPEGEVERTFDFVGEEKKEIQGYYIELQKDVSSGDIGSGDYLAIIIGSGDYVNYPDPFANPDNAGKADEIQYLYRVTRLRSGTTTKSTATTDYTYDSGTKTITVNDCQIGDEIKVWYFASSYISGEVPFTTNTSDPITIEADSVDIYLYIPQSGKPSSDDYLHKIQSCSIDVAFDRADFGEIGTDEIVLRGINEYTVTVTLDRYWYSFITSAILRGVASTYKVIDADNLSDEIALIIKVYTDDEKTTFALGYKVTGLSPTELRDATAIDEHERKSVTLESSNFIVTEDSDELGI